MFVGLFKPLLHSTTRTAAGQRPGSSSPRHQVRKRSQAAAHRYPTRIRSSTDPMDRSPVIPDPSQARLFARPTAESHAVLGFAVRRCSSSHVSPSEDGLSNSRIVDGACQRISGLEPGLSTCRCRTLKFGGCYWSHGFVCLTHPARLSQAGGRF